MNEFLSNNWFSIFTVVAVICGTAVNYGMSKQRGIQTAEAVADVKGAVAEVKTAVKKETDTLESYFKGEIDAVYGRVAANTLAVQQHINNSEAHVTGMFLELLKTRHEFVSQQLADTRSDISRLESILNKS